MRSRFLNLSATMGLVVSLFVATMVAFPAAAGAATAEMPSSSVYFPFVPNGYTMNGEGPFTGSVTIQNLESSRVTVTLTNNVAGKTAQTFDLNPHASATFGAADLGIDTGTVAGVKASAVFTSSAGSSSCVNPTSSSFAVTEASAAQNIRFNLPTAGVNPVSVTSVVNTSTGVTYVAGQDYNATLTPASGSTPGSILISWISGGAAPAAGNTVTVSYQTCPANGTANTNLPRIAGVEKHFTGPASSGGTAASTSSANTIVDGYTGLSGYDLPSGPQSSFVVPIIQNGWNGWNSTVFVTNLSGFDNALATITFYTGGGQGAAGTSVGTFTQHLAKGQTWALDTTTLGLPTGWVGSAWVSVDYPQVVVAVARNKAETNMSLTNTGEAATPTLNAGCALDANHLCRYAPLVFKDYNGWNTGINVANLGTTSTTVTVQYYNTQGDAIAQDQRTIPARAMEYIYRPAITPTNGTQDNNINAATAISAATITSTGPVHAAVDEVKYMSGPGAGQAMSYLAPSYGAFSGQSLALPLFQRGDATTGLGDTSGINIFNWGGAGLADVWFYDQSGALVAPTLSQPVQFVMGPFTNGTVYSLNFDEMPVGFQGSAIVENVTPGGSPPPLGQLSAVSNNVNYAVPFDGSAVYNLALINGLVSTPTIVCTPTGATNIVGQPHTISCTVTIGGAAAIGVPVQFTVTGANGFTQVVMTNASGVATFMYNGTLAGNDTITATVLNPNFTPIMFNGSAISTTVTKTYLAGQPAEILCSPRGAVNPVDTTHTVTCTVYDQYGNAVGAGVTVDFMVQGRNSIGVGSPNTMQTTDNNGMVTFTYHDNPASGPSTPTNNLDNITAWVDAYPAGPAGLAGTWDAHVANNVLDTGEAFDVVSKIWNNVGDYSGTLTASATFIAPGQTSTLTGTLMYKGSATASQAVGQQVGFTTCNVSGPSTGVYTPPTATTDANGMAQSKFNAESTGVECVLYYLDVNHNGVYNAGTDIPLNTTTIRVSPLAFFASYTFNPSDTANSSTQVTNFANGATVYLNFHASVFGSNLSGIPVSYKVFPIGSTTCTPTTGSGTTDASGNAALSCVASNTTGSNGAFGVQGIANGRTVGFFFVTVTP